MPHTVYLLLYLLDFGVAPLGVHIVVYRHVAWQVVLEHTQNPAHLLHTHSHAVSEEQVVIEQCAVGYGAENVEHAGSCRQLASEPQLLRESVVTESVHLLQHLACRVEETPIASPIDKVVGSLRQSVVVHT